MDHNQDHFIIQQLAAGDEAAFTQIYNCYWERLFKFVIRILPDEDDAADVLQETFISFWELREKLQHVRSIKAYLFTMTRNHAFRRFQHRLRQSDYLEKWLASYSEADRYAEQALDTRDLAGAIDSEVDKLPEKMREIFIMSRKEHLSHKEIADRLRISDLTVKKQISNTLKQLRTKMDETYIPYLVFAVVCLLA